MHMDDDGRASFTAQDCAFTSNTAAASSSSYYYYYDDELYGVRPVDTFLARPFHSHSCVLPVSSSQGGGAVDVDGSFTATNCEFTSNSAIYYVRPVDTFLARPFPSHSCALLVSSS